MRLISIQVGMPQDILIDKKVIRTAIFKSPAVGAVRATALGLEGDGQADLKHHGGRDKAVYGFGHDAYATWKSISNTSVTENGLFGENLTFSKLNEDQIFIGDQFKIGTCILEASEPRIPCFKFNIRIGSSQGVTKFLELDRPGVYFRVTQEGSIQAGDDLIFLNHDETNEAKLSIQELFDIRIDPKNYIANTKRIDQMLQIRSLSESWKNLIQRLN